MSAVVAVSRREGKRLGWQKNISQNSDVARSPTFQLCILSRTLPEELQEKMNLSPRPRRKLKQFSVCQRLICPLAARCWITALPTSRSGRGAPIALRGEGDNSDTLSQSRKRRGVFRRCRSIIVFGDKGELANQEDADAGHGAIKVLVIRDNKSKAVFAHVVPVKGVDEGGFAVKAIFDDIVWLGYTRFVMKTDNEPAILKLLLESLRSLRIEGVEQFMHENSPEYDPQANGSA